MRFRPAGKQRCKHYYKRPSIEMATEWDMQSHYSYFDDCSEKDFTLVDSDKMQVR